MATILQITLSSGFLAVASSSLDGFVWLSVHLSVTAFHQGQAALWMVHSVRLWHLFHYVPSSSWSHHHEIFRSYYHWEKWCPYQRSVSQVKVTEFKTNFAPIWAFPYRNRKFEFTDGYVTMQKAWSGIEEVPYCFSRSSVKFQGHGGHKIDEFDWIEISEL